MRAQDRLTSAAENSSVGSNRRDVRDQISFPLPDRDVQAAFDRLAISRRHYHAHQTIFEEGAAADRIFHIVSGDVRLYKSLSDGRRQITGFLQAGDFIGLMTRDAYAYGAEAINNVELCCMRTVELQRLLNESPAMGLKLLELGADELTAAQEQMLILGRKSAREKVLSFLLKRAERTGKKTSAGVVFDLPMSRGDLADYLGLCCETVSRTLTVLKQEGLLTMRSSYCVHFPDVAAIRAAASGEQVDLPRVTSPAYCRSEGVRRR